MDESKNAWESLKNVYGEELARQILFKNGLRRHAGSHLVNEQF